MTTNLEKYGIETIGDNPTINSELEIRINTRRKINRSIEHAEGTNNYCGEVFEFPANILQGMKEENDHFINKLLSLKKELSPFKSVIPKQSELFEVGAILTDSWGWDQTNIDFYCIVKRSGDWITILPMSKDTSEEIGFMTNEELPKDIILTADPMRKKIYKRDGEERGFTLRNCSGGGWCNLWEGKPVTSTHYA